MQLGLFDAEPTVLPAKPAATRSRKKRRAVEVSIVEAGTGTASGSGPIRVARSVEEVSTVTVTMTESVTVVVTEEMVTEEVAVAPVTVAPVTVTVAPREPRVLVFDCETTGTDKKRDQVIELCIQFGLDEGAPSRTWRFRPDAPISPGAQAVHNIGIEDLASCPSFGVCAAEIAAVFAEADVVVGYNLAFDIDMIQAEYERLGWAPLDFHGKTIVDPFRLWQQCEPRSLQHAHRRFVGDEFAAAHSASADVAATGRVLRGMLAAFELADRDWSAIATVCDPQRGSWVGPSRHLRWDETGATIILGFGKHAGTGVHVLAKEAPDYLEWLIGKDFPAHVGEVCRVALARDAAGLVAWARERYGQPAPTEKPPFAAAAAATVAAPTARV
jgi:DNA polymerase III subunit epsilon